MAAETEKKERRLSLFVQIFFPIIIYVLIFTFGEAESSFEGPYLYALKLTIFSVIAALINYNILLPKFWSKKRYIVYSVFVAMLIAFVSISSIYIAQFFNPFWIWDADPTPTLWYLLVVGASGFYKDISLWFHEQKIRFVGQKEKLEVELDLLKSQINPHFLFNTLNNIYALAETQDERTAPMISGLADMMRYIIYECKADRVSLEKEVAFIEGYIGLQKLKDIHADRIDFYVEGVEPHHQIAPLILINYVENAFKHGNIKSDPASWLNIELVVEDNFLTFSVENSYDSTVAKAKRTSSTSGGLGTVNSKRQMEIHYPNKHQLSQNQDAKSYELRLEVEL